MRDREMTELVSVRVPFGASEMMTDAAAKLGMSRSELMRRAVAAFIQERAASSQAGATG